MNQIQERCEQQSFDQFVIESIETPDEVVKRCVVCGRKRVDVPSYLEDVCSERCAIAAEFDA